MWPLVTGRHNYVRGDVVSRLIALPGRNSKSEPDQRTSGLLPSTGQQGALVPGCFVKFKHPAALLTILLKSQMVSADKMTEMGVEWSFRKGNGVQLRADELAGT